MALEGTENVLVRRLASHDALDEAEREAVRQLPMTVRQIPAKRDVVREGDRPSECCVILEGFAIRSKIVSSGGRQILAFHLPGDIPDLQSLHLTQLDHDLSTLTAVRAGFIRHEVMHVLHARHPRLAGVFWRETLIDAAIFREWIVGLGARDALSRTAHLLCEMFVRLRAVGLARGNSVDLPITQADLADALGMTAVHTNRTIQELRSRKLIAIGSRNLIVSDWKELVALADFDPSYLHLSPEALEPL